MNTRRLVDTAHAAFPPSAILSSVRPCLAEQLNSTAKRTRCQTIADDLNGHEMDDPPFQIKRFHNLMMRREPLAAACPSAKSTQQWSKVLLLVLSNFLYLPGVCASIPDVIIRITPRPPSTPLIGSSPTTDYSTIEFFTNRAQFGSREDISGTLVHSPQADPFLCIYSLLNETTAEILQPTNPLDQEDYIMLVPRGFCTFEEKARAAQEAYGVKGVLVYDRLSARYQWDTEAQKVVFPQDQVDYECANGEGVVENLSFDPPAYNGSILDPLLDIRQTSTSICNLVSGDGGGAAVCESQLCLVTSHEENSNTFPVCCAWDLPFAMTAGKATKSKHTDEIVAAFLTIRQSEQVVKTSMLGSHITIESRSKLFNVSYVFMWMLGTIITVFASWYAGGEYRRFGNKILVMDERQRVRRNNNNSRNSTPRRSLPNGDTEDTLEMTQITPARTTNTGLNGTIQTNDTSDPAISQASHDLEGGNDSREPAEQPTVDTAVSNGSKSRLSSKPKQEVWTLRSLPPERRRRERNTTSTNDLQIEQRTRAPGTMPSFEMTYWHVLIFIVVASLLLVLLFFFQFYKVIFVLYGVGCAGAISYILFNPMVVWIIPKFGNDTVKKFNRPILFRYNGFDCISQIFSYTWAAVWIWFGLTHYKPQQNTFFWITTDVFGACFCIVVVSLLKLSSIKIATALMVAVFVYDIFFVFLTPYLTGGDSVMLTVASGGGNGESFCYKYPGERSCIGVNFIPMLLIVPKVNDVLHGSVILGLGDIVLPGFLLAFCARYDAARVLVGSNSPALRIDSPKKWYQGFFFPMSVAYSLGLLLAFVAVLLMQQGQPALLYICPVILATVFYLGRIDLKQLWNGAEIFVLAESLMIRNERLWERSHTRRSDTVGRETAPGPVTTAGLESNRNETQLSHSLSHSDNSVPAATPQIVSLNTPQNVPGPEDICFRDQSHLGTQEFVRVVQGAVVEFAEEDYSPKIHKRVLAGLKNRNFFKRDASSQYWKVANKFEVRNEIGLAYDECRGKRSPFFQRSTKKTAAQK